MISAPFCASRAADFSLQRRYRNRLAALRQGADFLAQFAERENDGLALLSLAGGRLGRRSDDGRHRTDLGLDLCGEILHVARTLFRRLGQRSHFIRNDRKATAVVAGTRGLDRRIERQQVGLVRDMADGLGDIADAGRLLAQLRHDLDGPGLTVAIVLDIAGPRPDLVRGLDQQRLQRVGPAPRALGPVACLHQRCRGSGGDREGFLSGAGSFLGAAGDLLHRTAKFLGCGCCLGDPRRKLLGRRRNPLLDFLLAGAGNIARRGFAALASERMRNLAPAEGWAGVARPAPRQAQTFSSMILDRSRRAFSKGRNRWHRRRSGWFASASPPCSLAGALM